MNAPVRNARIVVADDRGYRADMTASWLAQMGWEVYVLDDGFAGPLECGAWQPTYPPLPAAAEVLAADVPRLQADGTAVIDLANSRTYVKGHVPGAYFAIRAQLSTEALQKLGTVIFTSTDGVLAKFAAAEFGSTCKTYVLAGGTQGWTAAGRSLEHGMTNPLMPPTDIYKRPYEGTDSMEAAMQAYLDWEYGLVAQLERDGTHGFVVI
jgi:rhodanese-related sulfurtransferase